MSAADEGQAGAVTVRRAWRAAEPRMPVMAAVALTVVAMGLALLPGGEMWALKAAGAFKGHAIAGVEHFVSALEGNVVWLGGTAMGLVIAVVAILFMAGHSRAHDIALKTVIGLAILASIGGIVA